MAALVISLVNLLINILRKKMKIKIDHVTNSSSASFMIPKSVLTEDQIRMIHDHIETAALLKKLHPDDQQYNFGYIERRDQWYIEETKHSIQGHTSMDNFDIFAFLIAIGIPNSEIHYEHS
jgi:hypothetical protein